MSVENLPGKPFENNGWNVQTIAEKIKNLSKTLSKAPRTALEWTLDRPFTRRLLRNAAPYLSQIAADLTSFDFSGFDNIERIDTNKTKVVFVASHFSHQDGTSLSVIAQEFRKRYDFDGEIAAPICQTLLDGRQGKTAQVMYQEIDLPSLEVSGVRPVYVYTENDKNKRNATPTHTEKQTIIRTIREDSGPTNTAIAVFAGGTVEPGRHQKDGTLNGLQEIKDAFLPLVLKYTREAGLEMLVIPVGISGSYRIFSADSTLLTKQSLWNIIKRGVGLPFDKLASAKIGQPFSVGQDINTANINDVVMRNHVAPLIKEGEQGHYKPAA